MSSPVKPRRRYDSTRRQEQAQHNRSAVLQAARQLFLERGFAATTMPAIASAAGVSVPDRLQGVREQASVGQGRVRRGDGRRRRTGPHAPACIARPGSRRARPAEAAPALRRVPRRGRTTSRPRATGHPGRSQQRPRGAGGVGRAPSGTTQGHDAVRPSPARRRQPAPRGVDRARPATCSGPTTPRSSSSCSSSIEVGHPSGTGAG